MNEPALKALAKFLTDSQAHLSILISMPTNVGLAKVWGDMRDKLGLRGWHDEAEAEQALRRVFETSTKPKKGESRMKRQRGNMLIEWAVGAMVAAAALTLSMAHARAVQEQGDEITNKLQWVQETEAAAVRSACVWRR